MDNVTQKTIPYNVLNYDNYTVYHLHSDYSNANGYADSCSKFKEYIKLAKKQNKTKIGSEDLLLAIIEEPSSLAMKVLGQLGVDAVEVRYGILNECQKSR